MAVPLSARAPVQFASDKLKKRLGDDAAFILVRIPTPYERDSFDAALVRAGVVYYSREQIRDLTLAGVAALHGTAEFDDHRAKLQELWAVGDAERAARLKQTELFLQLMEENTSRVPPLPPEEIMAKVDEIKPDTVMSPARRAETTAFQQDILSGYPPLQKAFADLAEQDTKRAWIQAETYVTGWTGKGFKHQPDGNGRGGIQRHEAEYLRETIGADVWEELSDFITAMHGIDGDTEKNLDSLLEKLSAPTGSEQQESSPPTGSQSGSSTGDDISPTPDTGSRPTRGRSRASTKTTGKKTGRSKSSPTAAAG